MRLRPNSALGTQRATAVSVPNSSMAPRLSGSLSGTSPSARSMSTLESSPRSSPAARQRFRKRSNSLGSKSSTPAPRAAAAANSCPRMTMPMLTISCAVIGTQAGLPVVSITRLVNTPSLVPIGPGSDRGNLICIKSYDSTQAWSRSYVDGINFDSNRSPAASCRNCAREACRGGRCSLPGHTVTFCTDILSAATRTRGTVRDFAGPTCGPELLTQSGSTNGSA